MVLIKLIPKSQRANDRITQHGNIMALIACYPGKILVESLGEGWNGNNEYFKEWYTEQECDWKVLTNGL